MALPAGRATPPRGRGFAADRHLVPGGGAGRAPGLGPDAGDVLSGGAAPGQRRAARGAARLRAAAGAGARGASGRAARVGQVRSFVDFCVQALRRDLACCPLDARPAPPRRRRISCFVRRFFHAVQDSLAAAGHSAGASRVQHGCLFPFPEAGHVRTRHHALFLSLVRPCAPRHAAAVAARPAVSPRRCRSARRRAQAAAVPGAERLRSGAGAGGRGRGDRRFQRDPGLSGRYQGQARWLPEDALGAAAVQRWLSVAAGQLASGPNAARLATLFGVPDPGGAAQARTMRCWP